MGKEEKNVKDKVANKVSEVVKNIKKDEKKKGKEGIKPLVTSRVLFISVLDKIYMFILLMMIIGGTYFLFGRGDISSIHYGFWNRVGGELIFLIFVFITYLFMNWFYKCAAKTMFCVTENEVYAEKYVPFKRSETSIPLDKITGVGTLNIFWIFRCIIIHRYQQLPVIFWTWNNKEFKDAVTDFITGDDKDIENEFDSKNIINKEQMKYVKYLGAILLGIIALIGVVRFFNYMFSPEKKVAGTYKYEGNKIVLEKNGDCTIDDLIENVTECTWSYDREDEEVRIRYTYEYKSFYTSTRNSSMTLDYNSKEKSLTTNNDKTFKK